MGVPTFSMLLRRETGRDLAVPVRTNVRSSDPQILGILKWSSDEGADFRGTGVYGLGLLELETAGQVEWFAVRNC